MHPERVLRVFAHKTAEKARLFLSKGILKPVHFSRTVSDTPDSIAIHSRFVYIACFVYSNLMLTNNYLNDDILE